MSYVTTEIHTETVLFSPFLLLPVVIIPQLLRWTRFSQMGPYPPSDPRPPTPMLFIRRSLSNAAPAVTSVGRSYGLVNIASGRRSNEHGLRRPRSRQLDCSFQSIFLRFHVHTACAGYVRVSYHNCRLPYMQLRHPEVHRGPAKVTC